MQAVLTKSMTFLLIVLLGYILRVKGFFKAEDSKVISKIVSRITLPCAILAGATQLTFSSVTLVIMFFAFFANLILVMTAKLVFRKNTPLERGVAMINTPGYNVGNVTIPFAQSFYPGLGMAYVCMFDVGNSFGWLGLSVALGKSEADANNKFSAKRLMKTLLTSIPFLTYLLVIVLGIFKLTLPAPIHAFISTIGSANSFLVMLMIGMMLNLNMSKNERSSVFKIVGMRMIGFIVYSCIVLVLPLPELAKVIILLCIVPSAPSLCIVFSQEIGDESAVPAVVNSICLILGIVCSTIILLFSI